MKQRIFKWSGWILFTGVLIALLSYALKSQIFRVKQVSLELETDGLNSGLFKGLQKQLAPTVEAYKGQYIWSLSLAKILAKIEQNKMVDMARVRRIIPNGLDITILPHKPQMVLLKGRTHLIPIGRDGSLLPPLARTSFLDLPVLRGKVFLKDLAKRKNALQLFSSIPKTGHFNQQLISEIKYNKVQGYDLVLNESGIVVKLGRGQAQHKADLIQRVLKYLGEENIEPRVIDARYTNKVIVKLMQPLKGK